MNVTVYTLSDPETNQVRYVGKTVNVANRFKHHINDRPKNRTGNWIKNLRGRGLKPRMEVLEVVENSDDLDWQDAERFWISYLRFLGCNLTNLDSGGNGGRQKCEETKARHRAALLGRRPKPPTPEVRELWRQNMLARWRDPEYRKQQESRRDTNETRLKKSERSRLRKWTPEQHDKMKRALLGHPVSEKTRQAVAESNRKRVVTLETRAKMSASRSGVNHWRYKKQRLAIKRLIA